MTTQTNAFTFNATAMHKAIEDYVLSARACEEADSKRVANLKAVGLELARALGKAGRADGFQTAAEIGIVKQAIQAEMPTHLAASYKDKQWEVIRAAAEAEGQSFKVNNDKAQQMSDKRAQATKDRDALIQATCKKSYDDVTAAELLSLTGSPEFNKLTATNQKLVVDAFQAKKSAEVKAAETEAKAAEKSIREELAGAVKNMHGENLKTTCQVAKLLATWDAKRLAKVLAALNKIK